MIDQVKGELYDELADIACRVGTLKAKIDHINLRLLNRQGDEREQQHERAALCGERLSLRLALLYKIEDNWPVVLQALRNALKGD